MAGRRIFLIVLDSFGIGAMEDAAAFGDQGCNTFKTITNVKEYDTPNMKKMGLFNIDGVDYLEKEQSPIGCFGRMAEQSNGKDTTIGHWEIAGIVSETPFPVYPQGFPEDILAPFRKETGRDVLCNKPYSGIDVLEDYGQQHIDTGALIVYTSADSVFQIAAHESVVPIEQLYQYCQVARKLLTGKHRVGRVIARPFTGAYPNFKRTTNRHDFSLLPPRHTMLDVLQKAGYATYGIGKIYDIFAGQGIADTQHIVSNEDGMRKTIAMLDKDFEGLCFVNLVDFDMVYGHRNNIVGYANAATEFDRQLGAFMQRMQDRDILMITADHGCDPGHAGTDHTREYTPYLVYGSDIQAGTNLGTRKTFADIAATILDIMGLENQTDGQSLKNVMMS